jgi:mono/diheme cytochrome c family protein
MAASNHRRNTSRQLAFAGILVAVGLLVLYAVTRQSEWSWPVPDEARQLQNPIPPSDAALSSARGVYRDKCARCHGDSGKGDGRDAERYDPKPADFTDAKRMSNVPDGELFYKISEGKKPMPNFKRKLTEEQRWQLVLLIRSFVSNR